ncbi:hypothetical protein C8Q76DRAFT_792587 [Earliella scabrosa]|nr:hypothetical protein C8Q76DRAFT_792587 [Earliella scabrosa]
MARTKQTAKRSTGEAAPRISLQPRSTDGSPDGSNLTAPIRRHKTTTRRSAKAAVLGTSPSVTTRGAARTRGEHVSPTQTTKNTRSRSAKNVPDGRDVFCYLCQNGGGSLGCDNCLRVICRKHLVGIPTEDDLTGLEYICPSCHSMKERGRDERAPYMGLYRRDGIQRVPYLDHPLKLRVACRRPLHARCNTEPIIIVQLRLASLPEAGTPARVVHAAMEAYFPGDARANLVYIDVPYNVTSLDDVDVHLAALERKLSVLDRFQTGRLLFFIYTHSEEESGDLFWADGAASETLDQWWDALVSQRLEQAGIRMNVTVALLCCGALVAHSDQVQIIQKRAEKMHATYVIAFGAEAVQAALSNQFWLAYVNKVFIEGVVPDRMHAYTHQEAVTSSRDRWFPSYFDGPTPRCDLGVKRSLCNARLAAP